MRFWTIAFLVLYGFATVTVAQSPTQPSIADRVASAKSLPAGQRDSELRKIAVEQAGQRPLAALRTLALVGNPSDVAAGLREMRLIAGVGSQSNGSPMPESHGSGGSPRDGQVDGQGGGQGGGSLADFTSLMNLIQTTIAPDTWEALGGPSTMSPYVAGIMVDGDGVVKDAVTIADGSILDNIEVMLDADQPQNAKRGGVEAWRLATKYRCVSLARLSQEILKRRISGVQVDDAIRNMAGLSRVQYVILDRENKDVVLVGPVGGIETHQGWMRDGKTGLVTMRLEYFSAAAASMFDQQPFGCTIDPTQQGLADAATVAEQVRSNKIPIGLAAEALSNAIGIQDVRVFGTAGDTPLGYLLVEADRHMKQLALGMKPMPTGTLNYLNVISRHIEKGSPDGQLLRLWFTGAPMAVRVDEAGTTFELTGRPLKLASETRLAAQDGGRIPAPADFRVTEFVDEFNNHFEEISALHPVYGALQSVFTSAGVAELLRRSDGASWIPGILGPMLLDDPSLGVMATPRKVDSIATLHRVAHRGKRHSIVVASGGVMIDTQDTIEQKFRPYPTLVSIRDRFKPQDDTASNTSSNDANNQWWWNVED